MPSATGADQATQLGPAGVHAFTVDDDGDALPVETVVRGAHLGAKIGTGLKLGIGDEALRADRDILGDDRVLDLGGVADARPVADDHRAAHQSEVADHAIAANDGGPANRAPAQIFVRASDVDRAGAGVDDRAFDDVRRRVDR